MITLIEAWSAPLDAAAVWMARNDGMSDTDGALAMVVRPDPASLDARACTVLPTRSQAPHPGSRPTDAGV